MKHSPSPHSEIRQGELGHYLHERPDLLLKTLEIAERCWRESPGVADAGPVPRRVP